MQQDELRQLAGAAPVSNGAAQQLAHIDGPPRLTRHTVGALVIVDGRNRHPPPLAGMVAGLGHDPAAGAATDQPGRRELLFEVMTQFLGIMSLSKIDQQQRRGIG